MEPRRDAGASVVTRWLLLFLLMFGVAAMHTIGHAVQDGGTVPSSMSTTMAPMAHHAAMPTVAPTAMPTAAPTAVHASGGSASALMSACCDGIGHDPMALCVAVLIAALALVAPGLLRWFRTVLTAMAAGRPAPWFRWSERGPPRLGLLLSRTVVLRI